MNGNVGDASLGNLELFPYTGKTFSSRITSLWLCDPVGPNVLSYDARKEAWVDDGAFARHTFR